MTTLLIVDGVCIWVLGYFKLGQSGHMMLNLDAIIALAPMVCVLGWDYYELHPIDEKLFISFSFESKRFII